LVARALCIFVLCDGKLPIGEAVREVFGMPQRVGDLREISVRVTRRRAAGIAISVRISGGMARAGHIGACGVPARVFHAEDLAGLIVGIGCDCIGAGVCSNETLLGFGG